MIFSSCWSHILNSVHLDAHIGPDYANALVLELDPDVHPHEFVRDAYLGERAPVTLDEDDADLAIAPPLVAWFNEPRHHIYTLSNR